MVQWLCLPCPDFFLSFSPEQHPTRTIHGHQGCTRYPDMMKSLWEDVCRLNLNTMVLCIRDLSTGGFWNPRGPWDHSPMDTKRGMLALSVDTEAKWPAFESQFCNLQLCNLKQVTASLCLVYKMGQGQHPPIGQPGGFNETISAKPWKVWPKVRAQQMSASGCHWYDLLGPG